MFAIRGYGLCVRVYVLCTHPPVFVIISQPKFRASSDRSIAFREMEPRKNLWDYVCHMWLWFVSAYTSSVHACLSYNITINIQSCSDPRIAFREMEQRKKPMGLCSPYKAMACMHVHMHLCLSYNIAICIQFREMEPKKNRRDYVCHSRLRFMLLCMAVCHFLLKLLCIVVETHISLV